EQLAARALQHLRDALLLELGAVVERGVEAREPLQLGEPRAIAAHALGVVCRALAHGTPELVLRPGHVGGIDVRRGVGRAQVPRQLADHRGLRREVGRVRAGPGGRGGPGAPGGRRGGGGGGRRRPANRPGRRRGSQKGRPTPRSSRDSSCASPRRTSPVNVSHHAIGTSHTGRASPAARARSAVSHAMSASPGSSGPTRSPCQVAVPSGCSSTPWPRSAQSTEYALPPPPGTLAMSWFASQNARAAGEALTISWAAQCAISGETRREISLSTIQSVMNSGWTGPRYAAVPRCTAAASRAWSAAGRSKRRSFSTTGMNAKRLTAPSRWMSQGAGRGSRYSSGENRRRSRSAARVARAACGSWLTLQTVARAFPSVTSGRALSAAGRSAIPASGRRG